MTITIPTAIANIGEDVDGYGSVLRGNEGIDGDGAWGRGGHYTKTYGATVGDAGRREDDGEWGHNTSGTAAEGSTCNIIDNTDLE